MKKYRRIEITAFCRRITVVSGVAPEDKKNIEEVCINDADSAESIETASQEGQRILTEALRLLKKELIKPSPEDV